jgi:hypothetical protein
LTLHERLAALAGEQPTSCPTQRLLDALSEDEARVLADLLADRSVSTFRIWQALRAEGYRISRDTISIHRQGRCYCAKATSK